MSVLRPCLSGINWTNGYTDVLIVHRRYFAFCIFHFCYFFFLKANTNIYYYKEKCLRAQSTLGSTSSFAEQPLKAGQITVWINICRKGPKKKEKKQSGPSLATADEENMNFYFDGD